MGTIYEVMNNFYGVTEMTGRVMEGTTVLPRMDMYNVYGVSRRYDGSRPQSVLVCACVRLWLCRPIRDAQIRSQT